MLEDIGRAVGLMLVFEGIMPFLAPSRWRNMAQVLDENNWSAEYARWIGAADLLALNF